MNLSEYTYLLNNPNAVNEKQAKALESVVDSFPFFQSARALYLKGLYNQDSYKYNFALKQTAAHTTDRSVLFDFITSDEFTIIEKDIYEQKLALLMDIDVIESDTHSFPVQVESEKEIIETEEIIVEEISAEEITTNEIEIEEIKIEEIEVDKLTVLPTVEFESSDIDFVKVEEISVENDVVNQEIEVATETIPEIETETIIEEVVEEEPIISEESNEISEEKTALEQEIIEEETPIEISTELEKPELEEKLQIGKPITFSQNEKHSFQEWLQLASFKPIERKIEEKELPKDENKPLIEEEKVGKTFEKQKKSEIIDTFIKTNPKITPAKEVVETPVKQVEISDTTHLMTETLARVYLEQKKYSKAIQAYEILILKYPEKSIFFADRIKDIKILQQNNL